MSEKNYKKRSSLSHGLSYGGWSKIEHYVFIESILVSIIEFRVYDCRWKVLHSSLPNKTPNQIRNHAMAFFKKISQHKPSKVRMFDFVRSKSMEFLKTITFDDPMQSMTGRKKKKKIHDGGSSFSSSSNSEPQEISESISEDFSTPYPNPSSKFDNKIDHSECQKQDFMENLKKITDSKTYSESTQSQVINKLLMTYKNQMMKLMSQLNVDIQRNEKLIRENPIVERYWNYMHESGTYLQQILADIIIVHKSEMRFTNYELPKTNN